MPGGQPGCPGLQGLSCVGGDHRSCSVQSSWPWARPALELSFISFSSQPRSETGPINTVEWQAVSPRGGSHMPSVPAGECCSPEWTLGQTVGQSSLCHTLVLLKAARPQGSWSLRTLSHAGSEPCTAAPFPGTLENSSTQGVCLRFSRVGFSFQHIFKTTQPNFLTLVLLTWNRPPSFPMWRCLGTSGSLRMATVLCLHSACLTHAHATGSSVLGVMSWRPPLLY